MKNIQILIPTRNRLGKLIKVLDSIPEYSFVEILVVCDGDKSTYDFLKGRNKVHKRKTDLLLCEHIGSVGARNFALQSHPPKDGLLYATDDIQFTKNSIKNALKTFNKRFPDDDGVVGFIQDHSFHPTGVGLVGKNFLNRYPKKAFFYPGYYHFACQEILRFCETFDPIKFIEDPRALIIHFHPGAHKDLKDQTHEEARKFKHQDLKLDKERQEQKLIWPLG